jgi:uncharacterized protein YjiS (DUF1127 family)
LRRVGIGFGRLTTAVLDAYHVRRVSRELMACSDLLLRDMGVTRSEISRVVRYGRD